MSEPDKNQAPDFNTLPGLNQSPTGPSFRQQEPYQAPKRVGLKLLLTIAAAVVGFVLIRVLF